MSKSEPNYPTDLDHALLAAHCGQTNNILIDSGVYKKNIPLIFAKIKTTKEEKKVEEEDGVYKAINEQYKKYKKDNKDNNYEELNDYLSDQWKIIDIELDHHSCYLGMVYENKKNKHIVVAHRSTNVSSAIVIHKIIIDIILNMPESILNKAILLKDAAIPEKTLKEYTEKYNSFMKEVNDALIKAWSEIQSQANKKSWGVWVTQLPLIRNFIGNELYNQAKPYLDFIANQPIDDILKKLTLTQVLTVVKAILSVLSIGPNRSGVQADYDGAVLGKPTIHTVKAKEFVDKWVKLREENYKDYSLSLTGHSLGAWLADIALYHVYANNPNAKIKAVTFDGPGSKDMINATFYRYTNTYNKTELLKTIEEHHKKEYLSCPNLVNTCNQHWGKVYALFPTFPMIKDYMGWEKNGVYIGLYRKLKVLVKTIYPKFEKVLNVAEYITSHDITYMINCFDFKTGTYKPKMGGRVISWPNFKHKEFDQSLNNQERSTVQSVISAFGDVLNDRFDIGRRVEPLYEQLKKLNIMTEKAKIEINDKGAEVETTEYSLNFETLTQLKDWKKDSPQHKEIKENPLIQLSDFYDYKVVMENK